MYIATRCGLSARQTAVCHGRADTYRIGVWAGIVITAARTTSREITRHMASNYDNGPAMEAGHD